MGAEEEEQVLASIREKFGAPEEGTPPQAPDATEETPGEPPAEGDTSLPGRNAQGQFVKSADEEPRLYAGKYKTAEDMEQALIEQEAMIGRQSAEVAEARRALGQQQPEQPEQPELDMDWLEELVEDDPYTAAEMARTAGDENAYNRVMGTWSQANPEAARLYHQNALTEARMAAMQAETQQMLQPVQQQLAEQRLAQAWRNVSYRHPEVGEMAEELAQAAGTVPELAYALQYQGQEERALEGLYMVALAQRQLAGQQPQQAAPPAAQAANPLADGFVASATSVQPAGQGPVDPDDHFREAFRQLSKDAIVSVSRGITRDEPA